MREHSDRFRQSNTSYGLPAARIRGLTPPGSPKLVGLPENLAGHPPNFRCAVPNHTGYNENARPCDLLLLKELTCRRYQPRHATSGAAFVRGLLCVPRR
jgi:hypothetical protein